MQRIREWSFPVGLLVAWMIASVYTLHSLAVARAALGRAFQGPAATSPKVPTTDEGGKERPAS